MLTNLVERVQEYIVLITFGRVMSSITVYILWCFYLKLIQDVGEGEV